MTHSYNRNLIKREHHPRISIGIFFVTLGVALLIATNDVFNLGGIHRYFTWETALIFIGVLLILNLNFTGGILSLAAGLWFIRDEINIFVPEIVEKIYWPGVIILIGLAYIISSFIKRVK